MLGLSFLFAKITSSVMRERKLVKDADELFK